ncbi:hypothetical protein OIU77_015211 [Salix suchowensis]|uniref:Uncharacterized protein n=1 Tax=Salix suchowensis TaxID=1278906 RepID=A0ABQ8ZSM1_9ROSI|nr:hypothetical protein OIU77_015211 [Salix suchowensis]
METGRSCQVSVDNDNSSFLSISGGHLQGFHEISRSKYIAEIKADDDVLTVSIPQDVTGDVAGNKNLASNILQVRHYSVPTISSVISAFATACFLATSLVAGLLTLSTATFYPPTIPTRKSERLVEKQSLSTPSRRPERACRMGNDTKASRKGKDEVSNDRRGTNIGSRSSSSLGAANDSCDPPTIPTRKSERLAEKQSLSTPSRRPERGKNQSASSSPGSKKSGKSLGSSIAKEKHKKVKSVKQLETEEVGNSDKPVIKTALVGIKRMDARAYRELFKQKQNKAKLEGSQNLIVNKTPGVDTEAKSGYKVMSSKQKRSIDDLNFDVESVDSVDSCSERQRLKKRSKVIDNNTDSPSLKAALKGNWLVSMLINCSGFVPYHVCTVGTSGAPVHKMSQVMPSSADLNTTDENHVSNGTLF